MRVYCPLCIICCSNTPQTHDPVAAIMQYRASCNSAIAAHFGKLMSGRLAFRAHNPRLFSSSYSQSRDAKSWRYWRYISAIFFSWCHFGSFLGHFGNFESFLGHFGKFWVIFGLFWVILGHFWAILAILSHFWAIMGNFGLFLGYFGSFWVIFRSFFGANLFGKICISAI